MVQYVKTGNGELEPFLEFQIVCKNAIFMSDINIRVLESLGLVIRMKDFRI